MDTNNDDLVRGDRVRIVSEDQAANLREQERLRELFEEELAVGGRTACFLRPASRLEDEDAHWDQLGEGSQDPGDVEPA